MRHLAPCRDMQVGARMPKDLLEKEPNRCQRLVNRAPGQPAFFDQIEQEILHLLVRQLRRGAVVVFAQPDQPVNVGLDRSLGIMPELEGVDRALPQGCCCAHGESPVHPALFMNTGVKGSLTQKACFGDSLTHSGLVQQLLVGANQLLVIYHQLVPVNSSCISIPPLFIKTGTVRINILQSKASDWLSI